MTTVKTFKGHDVPAGATHYGPDTAEWSEGFYKLTNGFWHATHGVSLLWFRISNVVVRDDLIEIPQEPEQWVPVVGEECEYLFGFNPALTAAVKIKAVTDEYVIFVETGKKNEQVVPYIKEKFNPVKTEREKIKEWVESKIDCIEDFQFDQAIMINEMLDLGCLVIPEDKQ